jgi:SulP family sulfate permease
MIETRVAPVRTLGPDGRPPTLRADAVAGLLGALLVLPQGFAFATLAGLPPEYGLATAIVPCAVAALFGSSLHVVSGPTNMISLALFATLAPLAPGRLAGLHPARPRRHAAGRGDAVADRRAAPRRLANFISPAALRGFTSGAAALIVAAQPAEPARHRAASTGSARCCGAVRAPVRSLDRDRRRSPPSRSRDAGPAPHLAERAADADRLVAATALAHAINRWWPGAREAGGGDRRPRQRARGLAAASSGRRSIRRGCPDLLGIAFALTIVTLAQSISIAKAVAERSGQAIDANREFRGQGLSNLVGAFASSYVSCGSLNRSMPNYEAARARRSQRCSPRLAAPAGRLMAPLLGLIPLRRSPACCC